MYIQEKKSREVIQKKHLTTQRDAFFSEKTSMINTIGKKSTFYAGCVFLSIFPFLQNYRHEKGWLHHHGTLLKKEKQTAYLPHNIKNNHTLDG